MRLNIWSHRIFSLSNTAISVRLAWLCIFVCVRARFARVLRHRYWRERHKPHTHTDTHASFYTAHVLAQNELERRPRHDENNLRRHRRTMRRRYSTPRHRRNKMTITTEQQIETAGWRTLMRPCGCH